MKISQTDVFVALTQDASRALIGPFVSLTGSNERPTESLIGVCGNPGLLPGGTEKVKSL